MEGFWTKKVVAKDNSLYICGGAFRDLEESLMSIYRIDLPLGKVTLVDGVVVVVVVAAAAAAAAAGVVVVVVVVVVLLLFVHFFKFFSQ